MVTTVASGQTDQCISAPMQAAHRTSACTDRVCSGRCMKARENALQVTGEWRSGARSAPLSTKSVRGLRILAAAHRGKSLPALTHTSHLLPACIPSLLMFQCLHALIEDHGLNRCEQLRMFQRPPVAVSGGKRVRP